MGESGAEERESERGKSLVILEPRGQGSLHRSHWLSVYLDSHSDVGFNALPSCLVLTKDSPGNAGISDEHDAGGHPCQLGAVPDTGQEQAPSQKHSF